MSITRKILVSVGIALLVLGAGYYLSQPDRIPRSSQQESSDFETPESFADRWNISSFTDSVEDDTASELPSDVSENDLSDTRFELTGRVRFPETVEGESVTVAVEMRHLDLPRQRLLGLRRTLYQLQTAGDGSTKATRFNLRKAIGNRSFTDLSTEIRTVRTDRSGHFSLSNVPVGIYSAEITKPSKWAGSTNRLTVLVPGLRTRLTLDASRTPTVSGRVTTPEGDSIEGVTVYEVGGGLSTKTDADGEYTLRGLDTGQEESLTVGKEGFMKRRLTLEPLETGEVRNRDITLRRGVDLTVRVRYPDGQPVKKGAVTFLRADTATRRADGHVGLEDNKGTHFINNIKEELNDEGVATFTSRHPGQVRVSFSPVTGADEGTMKLLPLMGGMKTVSIGPGESNEVTLEAYRGEKFDLEIVDGSTGEELMDWELLTVETFDEDGDSVKGFYRHNAEDISGLIRENVEQIKVFVGPRDPVKMEGFEPVTRVFSADDLPNLTVEVSPQTLENVPTETEVVQERKTRTTGGVTFDLSSPFNTTTGDWPDDTEGRLYLLDRATGEVLVRGMLASIAFEEPQVFPTGRYDLYGTIKHEGQKYALLDHVQVINGTEKRVSVSASPEAGISGELDLQDDGASAEYRIELAFSEAGDDAQINPQYPDALTRTLGSSGDFTFEALPPNETVYLRVWKRTAGISAKPQLIEERSVSTPSSGSTENVELSF